MTSNSQSGEALVRAGIISDQTLDRALADRNRSGKGLGRVLIEMGALSEEQWIDSVSRIFGVKTVQALTSYRFSPDLLALVPGEFAAQHGVFPLKQKEGMLATAVTDPFDSETLGYLARKTGLKVVPFLARQGEIAAAIKANYPAAAPAGSRDRKILVVDDSQAIASIIQAALQQDGYQVLVAHDGLEGLKLAVSEKPDLVITDTVMPRLDGFGLLRALKGSPETAKIPLILITAKSGGEDEQKALEAGFLDFIPKPVQPIRVVSRVKRAFELVQSLNR